VERVLRIVHRRAFFGELYDGLFAAIASEKDASMYCHTWKHSFGRSNRVGFDLHNHRITNTVCRLEIREVPYDCKYIHDSSGT
jgi:hypothetical protein